MYVSFLIQNAKKPFWQILALDFVFFVHTGTYSSEGLKHSYRWHCNGQQEPGWSL